MVTLELVITLGLTQSTGRATLDASAFDPSGLTSLRLGSIGVSN